MTDKKNKQSTHLSSPTGGQGAALQKLRHYCTYQERSHYEVIQKLWQLSVKKSEHDEIIATLIDEDYLNEERFAIQYAGGKFRMKEVAEHFYSIFFGHIQVVHNTRKHYILSHTAEY